MSTSKPVVLITGSNQGLGYYTAQQLASAGKYHVLLTSRALAKAQAALDAIVADSSVPNKAEDFTPIELDITSDSSIASAVSAVESKFGKLDVLVNNASIASAKEASGKELRELYQWHYETNVFSAACVTDAFLPLLKKGEDKRICFVSSGLGSCTWHAEGQYAGAYLVYRSTKSALNMIMVHYAQTLQGEGFIIGGSDPGYCATNLNNHAGFLDPREGAKQIIKSTFGSKEDVHSVVTGSGGKEPF
ncbi:hypothetical protein B0A48_07745 [Cryoendolithus antarcticus]|uniref:NAD(P)-binding protein n=1 Tax=Cryoendolithus antarcticus TaxID=1507870 RepID=A0A1V8T702_9PEZI|nr:hypothetical protein B0A48_07745 [Cryoendolithus antarcticus]